MAEEDYANVRMHQRLDFKAVIKTLQRTNTHCLEGKNVDTGNKGYKLREMLVEIENQIFLGGWDSGSASEALALQAQEPAFEPQIHVNMVDMAALLCNASIGLTLLALG